MKWISCLILALLVAVSFWFYYQTAKTEADMKTEFKRLVELRAQDSDDEEASDENIAQLKTRISSKEGDKVFSGILLTFLTAGLVGVLFVTQVLPLIAHKFTHAVYDSGEMVERDPMHDAHSLLAQGNYEDAVEAFRAAASADPLNRLPWVEIAKIQRVNLANPEAAIQTLRQALEGQEWQVSDAAFLLFRLAELYDEDRHDRTTAAAIMQQVIDEFPETRHSANARHKLHEWGLA